MTFNEQLIYLRKQKGLSQEQLGEEINVSRQTVSKWELGQTTPEMEKLIQLSHFFGISIDTLVGREAINDINTGGSVCNSLDDFRMYRYHYEYKSEQMFCGIPLIHVNLGHGLYKAKGILSIGNISQGVISIGAVSTGVLSFGAVSLGILSAIGAISIGSIAVGGVAIGIFAIGGCAIGVYSIGGCAIANRIAAGGYANAPIAIGDKTNGEFIFNINGEIPSNKIRNTILKKFPQTWNFVVNLFNSFS